MGAAQSTGPIASSGSPLPSPTEGESTQPFPSGMTPSPTSSSSSPLSSPSARSKDLTGSPTISTGRRRRRVSSSYIPLPEYPPLETWSTHQTGNFLTTILGLPQDLAKETREFVRRNRIDGHLLSRMTEGDLRRAGFNGKWCSSVADALERVKEREWQEAHPSLESLPSGPISERKGGEEEGMETPEMEQSSSPLPTAQSPSLEAPEIHHDVKSGIGDWKESFPRKRHLSSDRPSPIHHPSPPSSPDPSDPSGEEDEGWRTMGFAIFLQGLILGAGVTFLVTRSIRS
ncbi:MAG: hypothetical protein DHS80DRAFT_30361 [Piptocephalis tieghemiana]|nr:MAG: hypothetical protein DHS80DRAFT_30361 [Piptocephalis tieghemiana]